MMFLWLPFLFLVPLAMMWMMRPDTDMRGLGHAGRAATPTAAGPDPIEIARQRLARGEISTAEYEEIRHAIG